jgi:hypothetical protein
MLILRPGQPANRGLDVRTRKPRNVHTGSALAENLALSVAQNAHVLASRNVCGKTCVKHVMESELE